MPQTGRNQICRYYKEMLIKEKRERKRQREVIKGKNMYQIWHQPRNVTQIRYTNYTVTSQG